MIPSASGKPLRLIVKAHTGSVCWSWVSRTRKAFRTHKAPDRFWQLWWGLGTTVPSSWFTGFLLCPGAVICPTKAIWALKALPFLWPQMLLPLLMNDSDFRPLCAFFLLTNECLWPEETPTFAFVLFTWCELSSSSPPSPPLVLWLGFPSQPPLFLTNRTRLTSSG